jgi:NAD(P)-dependent dehydrogenase (short-subunit alcohol dehydrogenase family)
MKIEELFNIEGKKFFITAGHTGVGRMIAEGVIENGGSVVICGRRSELVQKTSQELQCTGFTADITTDRGIERCVDIVGDIDVLINCAGISYGKKFDEYEERGWDRVMNTNLTSQFFLIQKLIPRLHGGTIINIGSTEAIVAAGAQQYVYNASKRGVMSLSFQMQNHVNQYDINVNTLNIGPFDTELLRKVDMSPEQNLEWIREFNPQDRVGYKEDIIGPVIYLSSRAGEYVKGTTIEVSGGITSYLGNYMTRRKYLDYEVGDFRDISERKFNEE